jgi:nitrogen fixation protein FixH
MKFNWGTGIALVYGTFALSMIGLVIASRQHNPGLVQNDYYNLDIHYQAHIDKKQNTAQLAILPQAAFNASSKTVEIRFPEGMQVTGGAAKFYRSSTVNDDFTRQLESLTNGTLEVAGSQFHSGQWHVELDWQANGKSYFYESTFMVPNA